MTTLENLRAEIEQLENVCSKEHGCIAEVLQVIDKYAQIFDKYAEQELTSPCDLCKFNTKLMLIEANVSGYAQGLKESSKTGHWIKIVVNGQHKIRCDKCDYTEPEYATHIRNYCPNCGAEMVEPRESEVKE